METRHYEPRLLHNTISTDGGAPLTALT